MQSDFLLSTDLNNRKILYDNTVPVFVGSPVFSGSFTYDHDLGYIPSFSVWYEPIPGRWYPLSTRLYNDASSGFYVEIVGEARVNTSQIVVDLRNLGISYSNCNVRLRVYLDD